MRSFDVVDLVGQCDQLRTLKLDSIFSTNMLEHIKDAEGIQKAIVEIHRLENEADDILADALAGLYDHATDIPSLVRSMRWSDIYELLEEATDKAEGVAIALESIVIKHA